MVSGSVVGEKTQRVRLGPWVPWWRSQPLCLPSAADTSSPTNAAHATTLAVVDGD